MDGNGGDDLSRIELSKLWSAAAPGTTGADLRNRNRQHGIHFADAVHMWFGRDCRPFDGATNSVRARLGVRCNYRGCFLAINTVLLLVSSLTMELARRDIKQRAALAPLQSMPGISLGEEKRFPWLGVTLLLGLGFLVGQWMAWGELKARGFFVDTIRIVRLFIC